VLLLIDGNMEIWYRYSTTAGEMRDQVPHASNFQTWQVVGRHVSDSEATESSALRSTVNSMCPNQEKSDGSRICLLARVRHAPNARSHSIFNVNTCIIKISASQPVRPFCLQQPLSFYDRYYGDRLLRSHHLIV